MKMKKILTISFLLLYVTLSVGLNILVHTCGSESEALLVTSNANDPCVCANEVPMEDMCCKTELKTVKLDDSQKATFSSIQETLQCLQEILVSNNTLFEFEYSSFSIQIDTSPPPNRNFQISNSVFLI